MPRHSVTAMVWLLGRRLNDDLLRRLNEAGFTDLRPTHSVVFRHLFPGGSRVTDIAERAQTTRQAVWQLVAYLERRGYLRRSPDPTDRRARVVTLTKKGRKAVAAADRIITQMEMSWSKRIGARRFQQFRTGLESLVGATSGPGT